MQFNSSNTSFSLQLGDETGETISATAGISNDVGVAIGWVQSGNNQPTYINGTIAQTLTDCLNQSVNISNNFGSFVFVSDANLTLPQHQEITEWNNTQLNEYQYLIPVSRVNAEGWSQALVGKANGTSMTLLQSVAPNEFHEQLPGQILASINYNLPSATQNYMFQTANLTPTVTNDADADLFDSLNINYFGSTQQSGTAINFFQRGTLLGNPENNIIRMSAYGNEQWLKNALDATLLNLLVTSKRVGPDYTGLNQIHTELAEVLRVAILNGTIVVGKFLTNDQIAAILKTAANDNFAATKVKTDGYWLNVTFSQSEENGLVAYQANYLLIYARDEDVTEIRGFHALT